MYKYNRNIEIKLNRKMEHTFYEQYVPAFFPSTVWFSRQCAFACTCERSFKVSLRQCWTQDQFYNIIDTCFTSSFNFRGPYLWPH